MKILFLTFYFKPDLSAGSFRSSSIVEQLSKKGAHVDVITTIPNRYSSFIPNADLNEKTDKYNVFRVSIPKHKSGMLDQIRSFYFYYKEVLKISKNRDYDIVFATSSRLFTAFLGARIAKKKNLALYLDIRDIFTDSMADILPNHLSNIIRPFLNLIEKYTINAASKVNLVSPGFLAFFEERYKKKYSLFTNGIDDEFINISYDSPNKSNNIIKILYAGNIGEGQGLEKILPNLAIYLKDKAVIRVVGDGSKINNLKDSIVKQNISNIELSRPLKRSELIEEYINADVLFLHLNEHKCFEKVLPSKLFEYSATGKPILAGLSGYSKNFINLEINNCQIFKPGDVNSAIRALEKLSIVNINRKKFVKKFSRTNISIEMADDILSTKEITD